MVFPLTQNFPNVRVDEKHYDKINHIFYKILIVAKPQNLTGH